MRHKKKDHRLFFAVVSPIAFMHDLSGRCDGLRQFLLFAPREQTQQAKATGGKERQGGRKGNCRRRRTLRCHLGYKGPQDL